MPGDEINSGGGDAAKGAEDRKIFVGGIAAEVGNDDLISYFSQYGEVSQAQVKIDRSTGRSRGFAFVEFATPEACKSALQKREQTIKGKPCEVKPAKSRENKKVFVGGLPAEHPGTAAAAGTKWPACTANRAPAAPPTGTIGTRRRAPAATTAPKARQNQHAYSGYGGGGDYYGQQNGGRGQGGQNGSVGQHYRSN
ncbi:RRM domain-containing protein [Aphelenchoides fujianensis]|nr:RRM domain-containing protein [Aphelenchoides fujianensis]